ncbi:MAG: hypothetical protein DRJ14_07430 [Acidobacteria bacterium]|nr:MAG: hypothetical protein DRJ14_07430 [Acidobacteriota bacterium]
MKLRKIILTLSAVCILSFGAAALLLHSAQSFADSGNTVCNVDKHASGDLNQVNRIEVLNKTSADIRIIVSGTGKLNTHLYGTVSGNVEMKQPSLVIKKSGSTQVITASWDKNWQKRAWFNVHYRTDLKLDITIPESYAGSLSLVTASSDVRAEGFHGTALEIKTSSGDISFNGFTGKICKISTASGDVTGKDIQSDRTSINTASGDIVLMDSRVLEFKARTASGAITAQSVKTDSFSTRSASGDLLLSGLTGKSLSASSTSGELTVTGITGGNLAFSTTSGDIRLRKISGNLKARSTSGDVKADILSFPASITVSTTSGDIRLNITGKAPFGFEAETHGDISFKGPDGRTVTAEKNLTVNCEGCKKQVTAQSVSGDIEVR